MTDHLSLFSDLDRIHCSLYLSYKAYDPLILRIHIEGLLFTQSTLLGTESTRDQDKDADFKIKWKRQTRNSRKQTKISARYNKN